MQSTATAFAAQAVGLLLCASLASAHGHGDHGDMDMNMPDMASALPVVATSPTAASSHVPETYFQYGESTGLIYAHIAFMVIAWMLILPFSVMLSIARSRFSIPSQVIFLAVNAIGLFVGVVYNSKTPDFYPGNSHHKLGWAVTWIFCGQVFLGVLNMYARRRKSSAENSEERESFIPVSTQALAEHHIQMKSQARANRMNRYSYDSGHGTERASSSLHSPPASPLEEQAQPDFDLELRMNDVTKERASSPENQKPLKRLDSYLSRRVPAISARLSNLLETLYELLNRSMLVLGFVALLTGAVTFSGIFNGLSIFNGLAHFIKGAIFFWYGLLTLGRYVGSFADYGWAWNIKPSREVVGPKKAAIPSAEFVESFVIFFYGSTNVFLEHLAAWGSAWTAQDLEHVSISIMFFGGGLCGMLIESRRMRGLFNTVITSFEQSHENHQYHDPAIADQNWQTPKSYTVPLNPLPGLIILLLGMMMGSHHQSSMVSTMVHKQWGMLLVGFSFARAVTYITLYISPPTSFYPSRPPSELISAFCLISGGLIFMASNKDTIAAMEAYDLDAMFTFTVTMGFTAFLMAFTMLVIATKGWASRRSSWRSKAIRASA